MLLISCFNFLYYYVTIRTSRESFHACNVHVTSEKKRRGFDERERRKRERESMCSRRDLFFLCGVLILLMIQEESSRRDFLLFQIERTSLAVVFRILAEEVVGAVWLAHRPSTIQFHKNEALPATSCNDTNFRVSFSTNNAQCCLQAESFWNEPTD